MRSPTAALLWDIWRRKRGFVWAIVGLTITSRLVDVIDGVDKAASGSGGPTLLDQQLGMLSFLFLFGIFSYTESGTDRGTGRFPHRLFTLPVSSLRLVALPVLAGIASVELLYLLWMDRLSGGGSTSPLFVGVLLGAFMVFSQAALWTLARLGPLRLVVLGAIAVALFAVGLLPTFPPGPWSFWRSETVLAGLVAGLAVLVFLLAWRHIVRLRSGGGPEGPLLAPLVARIADALPRRHTAFGSPSAAQFWFEWRCSGLALPALVAGAVVVIGPFSWLARHDPDDTMWLLLATLATPIVLAIPVGMAFAKPSLWSDDLSVPSFVAVRPLDAEEFVAVKMRVAAVAVAISWLVTLSFAAVWLSLWANVESVSRLAIQIWAVHGHSVYAVCGIAILIVIAGMFLTWRFLVSRLWNGLSGSRTMTVASAVLPALVLVAWLVFDFSRIPGWMLEDPDRLVPVVWLAGLVVTAKYWLAAYSWRRIAPRLVRQYLLVWLAGTACFVTLAILLWGVVRMYLPMDIYRAQGLLILLALMAVPFARLGLAPAFLEKNRHRR